jgi:hypothetical protein
MGAKAVMHSITVPAKAGIQSPTVRNWASAFAGEAEDIHG